MTNKTQYIAKYQKANTIQVNMRLNKKYDADVIEFLNGLDDTGKTTIIKQLIREDMGCEANTPAEETIEKIKEVSEMEEKLFRVVEVAVMIDSSVPTISSWYRFKKENPEHELAKRLPDFVRKGPHRMRCWRESDLPKLVEFKKSIPQGRNGLMGSVTQRYVKKNKAVETEKEKQIKEALDVLNRNNVGKEYIAFIKELLEEDYDKRNAA